MLYYSMLQGHMPTKLGAYAYWIGGICLLDWGHMPTGLGAYAYWIGGKTAKYAYQIGGICLQ